MLNTAEALQPPDHGRLYCRWPEAVVAFPETNRLVNLEDLTDEELVARGRDGIEGDRKVSLEVLYARYYGRVSYWCLRICGDRDRASDLAQEVFLRVHSRLGSFRMESRFSTWLYTVTRSVAINRGKFENLRRAASLDDPDSVNPVDPSPSVEERAARSEIAGRFRDAMDRDLEPLEARILYLHFVDGLSLPAITEMLELDNRSGAKKYIVSAKRKMKRRFGRWLLSQNGPEEGTER